MPTIPIAKQYLFANTRFQVNGELPRYWRMNRLEAYYWGWQYEDLKYNWDDEPCDVNGRKIPIPLSQRKPKQIMGLPRAMVNTVTSFLFSRGRFPDIRADGGKKNAQEMIGQLVRQTKIMKAAKKTAVLGNIVGTVFWTFSVYNGRFSLKTYNAKVCFATFSNEDSDEPIEVKVIYKYKDDDGKWKWYRKDFTQNEVILYDTPEWIADEFPKFNVVEVNQHDLGFVPGVWIKNLEADLPFDGSSNDGQGLFEADSILRGCDSINYMVSQLDRALHNNLDPQLILTGITQMDFDKPLQRSVKVPWMLGKEGKADLLEATGVTFDKAQAYIKERTVEILRDARVILIDPSSIDIKADSSKALERLFAPMLAQVDEERVNYGDEGMAPLFSKMLRATHILQSQGFKVQGAPHGEIETDEVSLSWGNFFDPTDQELRENLDRAVQAVSANLLSEDTAVSYVASDFSIQDVESEKKKIIAEKKARVDSFSEGNIG